MRVHVYRNRVDDDRPRSDMHFCSACGGWYGVPHTYNHCREGGTGPLRRDACACRPCRESVGKPIEGSYGFFTESTQWQPPKGRKR